MGLGGAKHQCRPVLRAWLGALALAVLLGQGARAQVADSDRPLEGEVYTAADEAYKTFSQGDYRKAAARAGEAVTLRPDILRLRLLLIDALVAAGDLTQAEQAATGAFSATNGKP